jgi:hypothetical protein
VAITRVSIAGKHPFDSQFYMRPLQLLILIILGDALLADLVKIDRTAGKQLSSRTASNR